jgi:hypothetical protein
VVADRVRQGFKSACGGGNRRLSVGMSAGSLGCHVESK